jgi:hypothetical protein
MTNSKNKIWEGAFSIGRRTYFVNFHYKLNGNDSISMIYGATVFRGTKNNGNKITSITPFRWNLGEYTNGLQKIQRLVNGNFKTTRARYDLYPVSANMKIPVNIKTRGQIMAYFKTKKFRNNLVKLFCKHGVRWRGNQKPSLRQKEFVSRLESINKIKRRAVANYSLQKSIFKKRHNNIPLSKKSGGEPGYEWTDRMNQTKLPVHTLVFIDQNRIFHIVYQRFDSGHTRYAACIHSPKYEMFINEDGSMDEEDWDELESMGYNETSHILTSNTRFEYPVEIYLPSNKLTTRSMSKKLGKIDDTDYEIIRKFRKKIAKYGVRVKQGGNHSRFITTHTNNNNHAIFKKKINKLIGEVQVKYSTWKNRTKYNDSSINRPRITIEPQQKYNEEAGIHCW